MRISYLGAQIIDCFVFIEILPPGVAIPAPREYASQQGFHFKDTPNIWYGSPVGLRAQLYRAPIPNAWEHTTDSSSFLVFLAPDS